MDNKRHMMAIIRRKMTTKVKVSGKIYDRKKKGDHF
jgi:hypothetical protein